MLVVRVTPVVRAILENLPLEVIVVVAVFRVLQATVAVEAIVVVEDLLVAKDMLVHLATLAVEATVAVKVILAHKVILAQLAILGRAVMQAVSEDLTLYRQLSIPPLTIR